MTRPRSRSGAWSWSVVLAAMPLSAMRQPATVKSASADQNPGASAAPASSRPNSIDDPSTSVTAPHAPAQRRP